MQVVVVNEKEALSTYIARDFMNYVSGHNRVVFGLATGSTFTGVYKKLVHQHQNSNLSFKPVMTFNLDEYMDLESNHPQTYRNVMNRNLFDCVDIDKRNTFFPPIKKNIRFSVYDDMIEKAGGIDCQYLGIGVNGHIAFNEPGTSFTIKTHKVALADATREANKRFFDSKDQVPKHAVTMGLSTIMKARRIVLAASGEKKAEAIRGMLYDPISEQMPATVLRQHSNVVVVLDRAAAQFLEEGEYDTTEIFGAC